MSLKQNLFAHIRREPSTFLTGCSMQTQISTFYFLEITHLKGGGVQIFDFFWKTHDLMDFCVIKVFAVLKIQMFGLKVKGILLSYFLYYPHTTISFLEDVCYQRYFNYLRKSNNPCRRYVKPYFVNFRVGMQGSSDFLIFF